MDENYKRRINQQMYFDIFNEAEKLPALGKISYDMTLDLIGELVINADNNGGWDVNKLDEKAIYAFTVYLFDLLSSYLKLLPEDGNMISIFILQRTIIELCIKLKWLIYKDDSEVYLDFMKDSLVAEKLYLAEIENHPEISENFKKGTRESIYRLCNESGIEIDGLSKNKIKFENIEKMANELIKNDLIPRSIYEIVYRTYSNYTHAGWSAIQMNAFRNTISRADVGMIVSISIQIIDLFVYINKKYNNLKPEFLKDLDLYEKAFLILNREDLRRINRL